MDVHEGRDADIEQVHGVADRRCADDHAQPQVRVKRREAADEQRGCGVRSEYDALGQRWRRVIGAGHPVDESAHDGDAGEHGDVGHDGQLDGAGGCQLDRSRTAQHPTDLRGADIGRNDWNGSEDQDVGQVHVADGFFLATDFLPFLIGMGEEPPHMMDHVSILLFL